MRPPRMWIIGRVSLIGVVLLALGFSWREDRYSCHLCRALKEEQTTSLLAYPIRSREKPAESVGSVTPHQHVWWRYSYEYSNGLGGCLGAGVACHTDGLYKDEQGKAGVDCDLSRSNERIE